MTTTTLIITTRQYPIIVNDVIKISIKRLSDLTRKFIHFLQRPDQNQILSYRAKQPGNPNLTTGRLHVRGCLGYRGNEQCNVSVR